ncbi:MULTISPECIES: Cdc6/Cdc18 family protein [Halolamina]|uniref:Cdc6-related protein, AAA superfamily ATPase n=1 Tax=Halolamina pelagica TaxID=699431 RepID=A0A1I5U8F6_9EURY|nr:MULTISPECIES: Cdc6/Cdc18 family protein [Halolamina]NHX37181.1 AAA family ATPase [Halolamina sp. R1-12]SFP91553.1 Cdc6-related protein, AAA superfamily ATPase [Halolamina pelagica]
MYVEPDKLKENYLPNAMPGREPELQRISDVLEPATEGEPAGSVWEIGPSGVGKTSTAKFLLDEAQQWGVDYEYVPCTSKTRWQALRDIADAHPAPIAQPSASTGELADWIASREQPFVVILDEIAGLDEPELLADLARAEWLSLILIGHKRSNALGQVPDHADRLRFAEIVEFDPYDTTALFDILDARRTVALQRGVIDDSQLERIVAEAGGSARFGVQALRSAVDLGIERGHTTVQPADVDDCFERAHDRIRKQQLESLGRDHHLVYRAIREHGPLRPQRIYEHYQNLGGESTRQSVVNYRKKLDEYDLIECVEAGWVVVDETLAAPRREARVA